MRERWLPIVLTGTGVVLGCVMIGELVLMTASGAFSPDAVVTYVSSIPFVVLLVGSGYWLPRSGLTPNRYPRIAGWALGGTGFLVVIFGVIAFATQDAWTVRVAIIRWAVSVGAGAGLLVGVFEGRAIERTLVAERVRIRNEELHRQNERLDEVAGVIAHDLRNPLNVAEGYLELAREDHDDERLDGAATALDRMSHIVDDTLELARSGRVIEDPEPVTLPTTCERCWDNVATEEATLEVEGSTTIVADPDRLKHLFENLFRNSVEHAGEDVTVTVGALPNGFYVADDGPGIPPADREDVFDASYSTSTDGNGFGLALVRQIAEAHGWSVDVTEAENGGARFEITGVETATPLASFPVERRLVGV